MRAVDRLLLIETLFAAQVARIVAIELDEELLLFTRYSVGEKNEHDYLEYPSRNVIRLKRIY